MRLADGSGSDARGLWIYTSGTVTPKWTHLGDVDPTVYHTYQAVYDPVTDDNLVSFYVDGSLFATYARNNLYYAEGVFREFGFGDGAKGAESADNVSRWALARLC